MNYTITFKLALEGGQVIKRYSENKTYLTNVLDVIATKVEAFETLDIQIVSIFIETVEEQEK